MKQTTFLLSILLLATVTFTACEKVFFETVSTFNVRLTASSAFAAEQLNVEVKSVEVNYDKNNWVSLSTPGQVYNLLEFRNSNDTLLAAGTIDASSVVKQMRITFGTNNSLKLGGKLFPVATDNNATSITLMVDRKLNRKVENVTVVMDPAASVKQTAEGGFIFVPVATIK